MLTSLPLARARAQFAMDERIAYFNTAAVGPRLHSVSEAGKAALDRYATPWLLGTEDWFHAPERLRSAVGALIGVSGECLAFVPSVSYAMAAAVRNIPVPNGSTIVVLDAEFPSAYYAWSERARDVGARLRVATRAPGDSLTAQVLACIDEQTSVVAVPACHWTDGRLVDLVAVGAAARRVGAALVVDASQALGALPLDIAAIQPDLMVAVGYKWLLGAYGFGYTYFAPKWHTGVPVEQSWLARARSDDFARLVDYTDEMRPGARRYDSGEMSQFISVAMSLAAIEQLTVWSVAGISSQLGTVTATIRGIAARHGFAAPAAAESAPHLLGISHPDGLPADTVQQLASRGVRVSVRGPSIRIAPHLHTSQEDLARLDDALGPLRP
jgi:selenocysteine lyase/cysteine desulfurase